ncbi:MAG: glutamine-hydrolyzing GMP synthase [Spirochaetaceae bacterium]
MDSIAVLDFGSQTTQLIGRRIRELGVHARIFPGTTPTGDLPQQGLKGVVLSGSPSSVYDAEAPRPDPGVYDLGVPILGICYGLQRMVSDTGGTVARDDKREFGRSAVRIHTPHPLFADIPEGFVSWMSHGDRIIEAPAGATVIATTNSDLIAAVAWEDRPHIGIQFHPEVSHCEYGTEILKNFCFAMCGASADWSVDRYLESRIEAVRERVGDTPVLTLVSGGVDSTVAAGLMLRALPSDQVHLMFVDTGLLRRGEREHVEETLGSAGADHLHVINAAGEFLGALAGVTDPEEKRRIIGDLFMTVQQREIAAHLPGDYFLVQGTLYTDLIESGRGVGRSARVIKTHHNVGSPLVAQKRAEGRIIEPLDGLYKDEVRALGALLGVPQGVLERHPFPGPGLAVRILGEVTPERCETLRAVDDILIRELRARGLYTRIWQAFSVLLPVRSVGVVGDVRGYADVAAIRCVVSEDGMTADVYRFPYEDLFEISATITNRVEAVGRVVYDVSSKPPSTIEWE